MYTIWPKPIVNCTQYPVTSHLVQIWATFNFIGILVTTISRILHVYKVTTNFVYILIVISASKLSEDETLAKTFFIRLQVTEIISYDKPVIPRRFAEETQSQFPSSHCTFSLSTAGRHTCKHNCVMRQIVNNLLSTGILLTDSFCCYPFHWNANFKLNITYRKVHHVSSINIVNKFLLHHKLNVSQWKIHWPTRNWTWNLPLI